MRIRSALAAAVLAAALTATGAATATAATDGPRHQYTDDHKCSPYFGVIDTETADLQWGGANCYDFF